MYSHEEIIDGLVICQVVFIFCFLISSFVVVSKSYGGFGGLMSGLVYAGFAGLTYYGLRRNINRTLFGVVLGGAFILCFVTLEASIFWGQYSNCGHAAGVFCAHESAMKSMCAFSVFLFLSYLVLLGVLFKFKNDILGTAPLNEGYSPVSTLAEKDGFQQRPTASV